MPAKRRRRFQGLYYHSSPPKVLPMNGQLPNDGGRRRREIDDFSVKLSTIRIWMHEKDIGKLTRILWAGQGNRLRQQASTNAKVKRFLAAVPYVMNSIRDVHQAVIDNSLETLQAKLEPPVPPSLVTCRDANGLNLIHKAAGLGHATILEYLITTWPDGVHDCDITGKTPLHWAASAKNNMRCYTLLTQAGCDEEVVDYKMKTPSFYRHKPHEIERAFLHYVPEAPRVSPDIATDWEALSDDSGDGRKPDIKIPEMNGFGRHSNAESNENTSEAEMTEGASAGDDEDAGGGETEAEVEPETEPEAEGEAEAEDKSQEEETEQPTEDEQPEEDEDAKEDDEVDAEADEEDEEEPQKPAHKEEPETQDEKQTQSNNESDTEATADKDEQEQHEESNESEVAESSENGGVMTEEKNENSSEEIKDIDDNVQESIMDLIQEKDIQDNQEDSKDVSQEKDVVDIPDNNKDVEDNQENNKDVEDNQENNKDVEDNQETNKDVEDNQENNKDVEDNQETNKDVEDIQENNKDVSQEKDVEEAKEISNVIKDVEESIKVKDENEEDQVSGLHKNEKVNGVEEVQENSHEDKEVNEEELKNQMNKETKDKEEIEADDKVESDKNIISKHQEDAASSENVQKEDKDENENDINETEEKMDKKTSTGDIVEKKGKQEDDAKDTETDKQDEKLKDTNEVKEEGKEENDKEEKETQEALKETAIEVRDDKTAKQPQEAQDSQETKNVLKSDEEETNKNHEPKVKVENDNVATSHGKSEENPTNSSTPDNKNGKAKTDEDENNNSNATKSLDGDDDEDDDVVEINTQKLSDISEELQGNGESFLQEVQQDISDKFDEISENLKDNVKILSDKIKNVFSSSDEKEENSDATNGNDHTNEVIVHSASSVKSAKKPKQNGSKRTKHNGVSGGGGGGESSDDTNEDDEDEETEAAAAAAAADGGATNDNKVDATDNQPDADESEAAGADESAGGVAGDSPTSSLAIEGFVHGEAEDNTVQSQTAAYVDDDNNDEETRLSRVIASGDMEQLAQIVLNGDGQKLLDVEATEPEIQAFLRNVPNYMDKIRRVHEAARSGSLLNLQQALDRRKFAVAKDEISPNGATPLHVAVLFGHSDIIRYLAARFPETTTICDSDGRTALHYAAVINDNGHFYNVLLQLGANPKALDKMGKTPEQYLANDELKQNFNYGQLLKNFGAEDLESNLLSDQGQIENHSFQENPIFKTEQGKYLADNLADPLIKALTQVAHKRPQDPLQYLTNYLQTVATTRTANGKTLVHAAVHSGSSHTNSTALANSNQSPPPAAMRQFQPTSQMNGHVRYDNADDIEDESLRQLADDDDGNDSDAALSKKLEERDEHGQSMLHFASARSHRRGGLLHLIEESKTDITYRDELYRTARDVALQANQVGNAKEIDRYLISLAVVGDVKPFESCALSGYDHIIDVMDENEVSIIELAESKGHTELAAYLKSIRPMEELREEFHQMIRDLRVERVKEIANGENGKMLIMAKNYYGRTALHIAILKESEEMIEHFVNICPEALKLGDNLERTPLHYAMGTNVVEGISRVLIQNGAKRTNKDLKGRQPSYYFMNKADILRLQEEEDESR